MILAPRYLPRLAAIVGLFTRYGLLDFAKGQGLLSLEGLALTYRKTLEGLEDVLGRKITRIHVVGGGSQNDLLNQMTADACEREVVAGPVEATAIGNILVQAMAVGDIRSLAEARQVVCASFDVKKYQPQQPKPWNEAYARYREVMGK